MCDKVYKEFEAAVELTPHKIDYFERGFTPYRRPPYSLVSDSFIALGDAACITKPSCGEGVTAAMVQMDAALEVILPLFKEGKECSRDNLWIINKKYIDAQGADFANQMAVLIGAVASSAEENEYFFANDLIFSTNNFIAMGEGEQPQHDFLYWEFGETDQIAVREVDWKLVVKRGTPYLYNLKDDIHEDKDVAVFYPQQVRRMIDIIYREHTPSEHFKVTLPERK